MTETGRVTSPFTCGLEAVLFVLSGKWKPLILFQLSGKTLRYGELRLALGRVSDKVLIQQLKELQADGIPPKVDYSLTPFGDSLAEALVQLCGWGTQHTEEITTIVNRRAGPS